MDKKILALAGAVSAVALPAAAQSYAELLQPIPNAAARLREADSAPPVKEAQVWFGFGHHHHHNWHHHHHNWYHHHHHHHHWGWGHHHHHHHWGWGRHHHHDED